MKNNKSAKDISANKRKDYVTNKLLLVFTLAFAILILLMNVSRMMKSTTSYMVAYTGVRVFAWLSLAALVIGLVMMFVERKKGTDTSCMLLSGKNISIAAVFVAVCAWALSLVFSRTMLMLLYIFIPAVVVLYIVYYSYQREFFMIALSSAIGAVSIWVISSDLVNDKAPVFLITAAVLIVALAAATIAAQLRGGVIKLFGKELTLFNRDTRYALVYITFVLVLALLAAAFIAADLALYYVIGLVAYIVLTGVYYTVKLI